MSKSRHNFFITQVPDKLVDPSLEDLNTVRATMGQTLTVSFILCREWVLVRNEVKKRNEVLIKISRKKVRIHTSFYRFIISEDHMTISSQASELSLDI